MTPDERKKALGHGGAAKVARSVKRSPAHVHYVIYGLRRDVVVERAVAKRIGQPVEVVFPPETRVA